MSQKKFQDAVPSQPKPIKPTTSSVQNDRGLSSPPKTIPKPTGQTK